MHNRSSAGAKSSRTFPGSMAFAVVLLLAFPLYGDVRGDIDAFARRAMQQVGTTPGLAVVVVKGDSVVYRGNFGLRDVAASLPVTSETHFYLASTTKAFVAMAAAILAEEGKVDLDAPISGVWPELKLTPPLDPKRLSLRDLLAMRSGLANDTANFRIEIGNLDDRELMRVLETYSKEEPRTFRYSNLNYVLAGRVLEKATGKSWFELVSQTVLAPVGMRSTLLAPAREALETASCYRLDSAGRFVAIPPELTPIAGPAGGLLSTTDDVARWLIAMLHDGRVGDAQALPRRAVQIVRSEQTTQKKRYREFDRFAWGLGEDLADYEGDLFVHRFGGLNGAYSHVSFMPDREIGVAVFSNGGGAVADAVAAYAYDLLLGKKDLEAKWAVELANAVDAARKERESRQKAEAAIAAARGDAAHPLADYAATYHYDRLGTIVVTKEPGRLLATLGMFQAELIPTGGDTFLVDWTGDAHPAAVRFVFDGERAARIDWGGRLFDRVP